jgi:hypothetical protein
MSKWLITISVTSYHQYNTHWLPITCSRYTGVNPKKGYAGVNPKKWYAGVISKKWYAGVT